MMRGDWTDRTPGLDGTTVQSVRGGLDGLDGLALKNQSSGQSSDQSVGHQEREIGRTDWTDQQDRRGLLPLPPANPAYGAAGGRDEERGCERAAIRPLVAAAMATASGVSSHLSRGFDFDIDDTPRATPSRARSVGVLSFGESPGDRCAQFARDFRKNGGQGVTTWPV